MRSLLTALLSMAAGWVSAQNNIVGYESWLDEQDADGQRTYVAVTPNEQVNITVPSLALGSIQLGLHSLHVRLKDSNNAWSSVLRRRFYVTSGETVALIAGEYWFDQNDADQDRTSFSFSSSQDLDITIDPVVSGLALGLHRIHFRIRDDHGQWSAVVSRKVHITSGEEVKLTLLRYWSDDSSAQPSDVATVTIEPNVMVWDVVDEIGFCNWQQTGATDVYFQLQDDHGQWSSVIQRNIDIDAATAPPSQPGTITGPFAPPFGSTQTYSIGAVANAGAYEWTLPNGWTGSSTSTSITVEVGSTNDGSQLCVRALNGCGVSDPTCLQIITGINGNTATQDFTIYPNPTSGLFTITLDKPAQVTLIDATGRIVLAKQNLSATQNDLDMSHVSPGVYTVVLARGLEVVHRSTLVKQ